MEIRTKTDMIVIHHSASADVSADVIRGWHLARGWSDIGYHFVVRKDGSIENGRAKNLIGAHTMGYNRTTIGICFTGNFDLDQPEPVQLISAAALIIKLNQEYRKKLIISRHCDLVATKCPGKNFDLAALLNLVSKMEAGTMTDEQWMIDIVIKAQKSGLIKDFHEPQEMAPKWFVLQIALNILDKLKG